SEISDAGNRPSIFFARCARGAPGTSICRLQSTTCSAATAPEPHQVREHRAWAEAPVDLVALPDLRMPVAICRVGELEWDVALIVSAVHLRASFEQLRRQLAADQAGQELAQDHVLVVPRRR